jgi:hypothetical protein
MRVIIYVICIHVVHIFRKVYLLPFRSPLGV